MSLISFLKKVVKRLLHTVCKSDSEKIEAFVLSRRLQKADRFYKKVRSKDTTDIKAWDEKYIKTLFDNRFFNEAEQASEGKIYRVLKLVSVADWAKKKNYAVHSVVEVEEIPVSNPPTFDSEGLKPATGDKKIAHSIKPYVAELEDVKVFSKSSVITTPDGFALNDVAAHPLYSSYVSLVYDKTVLAQKSDNLLVGSDYPIVEIEKGIFLSGLVSEFFGHWVPEFLMKLKSYEQHPDFKDFPLIVDDFMPQSHFDYLSALVDNPIIRLPEKTAFLCKKLLVAPPATFYPVELVEDHKIPQHEIGPLSPEGLLWLREKVLSRMLRAEGNKKSAFGKKLYLSRRNMLWRRASNDEEICQFLEGKGFDIIDAEKVSFEDQVLMFRDAECVIAPNGSSMLNLIFAPKDIKLLVLSQPEIYNWGGYYGPLHSLGYEMVFVVGDKLESGTKHTDYTVPVERIKNALSLYGEA